jgi:hypothetical protein
MKLSDLKGDQAKVKDLVLKSYAFYRQKANADPALRNVPGADLPDAQVFVKGGAVIVILPERHDSTNDDVQAGALNVAKAALAIPKVKIAVEEPKEIGGTLISNVGIGNGVTAKHNAANLFEKEPAAQGSISHQIYVKQVGGMLVNTTRYAAEKGVTPRYGGRGGAAGVGNPKINKDMVDLLHANTSKGGEISIFPVGPDHLKPVYDPNTLKVRLEAKGWEQLENK